MKLHRADLGFIGLCAAYVFSCWLIVMFTGFQDRFTPLMYLGTSAQMSGTFLLGYLIYRLMRALYILFTSLRAKQNNPLQIIFFDLKNGPLRPIIYQRALPVFIAFIFFFSTFTSMKFLIADIEPFRWDRVFIDLDRIIHFGIPPWEILQPILGYPLITHVISFFYILWLPVMLMVLYWQLFRFKDDALRMRFLYTFVLTWAVNGTFLAIVFSSAGPCYFEKVTGLGTYNVLMEYLKNANEQYQVYSVYTQDLLWRNYRNKDVMLGGGISAFPSVHVATAFLFMLVGWSIDKFWCVILSSFFVIILLGSIHLGWHYAVDGYFAIITTWILWWLSGQMLKNHYRS